MVGQLDAVIPDAQRVGQVLPHSLSLESRDSIDPFPSETIPSQTGLLDFNRGENIMATAKSAEQYRKVWNDHLTEFTSVLLESGAPANEWDATMRPLRTAIETAIERLTLDGTFEPVIVESFYSRADEFDAPPECSAMGEFTRSMIDKHGDGSDGEM